MKNRKTHIFLRTQALFVLLGALMLLVSCSDSSTEPDKGITISGQVVLEETGRPASYDNIHVAAYLVSGSDSELESALELFPAGAIDINSDELFDYRDQTPLVTVMADGSGNFSMTGVSGGDYRIVVFKEGYGFDILGPITVEQSKDVGVVNLYAETTIDVNTIDANYTFAGGRHYVIDGDLFALETSTIVIESGAWVRLTTGSSLNLMGNVFASGSPQDPFHICCNDGYQSFPPSSRSYEKFQNIHFYPTCYIGDLSHGIIENYQVVYSDIEITLSKMVFRDGVTGVVGTGITANGCLFDSFSDTAVIMEEDSGFEYCIFLRSNEGFESYGITCMVANCYFASCFMGLYVGDCDMNINHNVFVGNDYGIALSGSVATIEYNKFDGNTIAIEFNRLYAVDPHFIKCTAIVSDNNFYLGSGEYYVENAGIHDMNWGEHTNSNGVSGPVQGIHNYWDESDIDTYIRDDEEYTDHIVYEFIYSPVSTRPVDFVGIQ